MTVGQSDFTAALLDPDRGVPPGLSDPAGRPAGRRFSVYRNNVAVSLTDALETAFPVIRKLLGDEFFRAMAGVYLRAHPPSSPMLFRYGARMPDFLEGFDPVSHLAYLPDIARLELALRQSYHAADAAPADPAVLQQLAPDALVDVGFDFVPAMRLIRSDWPIHAIWMQNSRGGPAPVMQAQSVLVARPGFDPEPLAITAAQADFITALAAGQPLGAALDAAGEAFDLAATLALLIGKDCIAQITLEPPA